MRSSNPILSEKALERDINFDSERRMSVSNTMSKFFVLMIPLLLSAGAVYYQFMLKHYDMVNMLMTAGMFIGLVLAFIIAFKPKTTIYLAPVYAFCEGAFLSGLSCFFEQQFPGIVIQAVSLTFATAIVMAALYSGRIIKVSETFRSIVVGATISVAVFYLIAIVLTWGFHMDLPILTAATPLSIGFSIFVCVLAALNLILDYDFIERSIANNAPEDFGWYAAFGLMVTLVWLYVEVLRLLSKLNSRN
ncbi:Bax inhibitor-1/YccA family protein [bacterium]|nr:Bax inhibitor-1/YccA family protein [bacterium]